MALTFGAYAAPDWARPLAVGAVVALTVVTLLGVTKTAWVTRVIVTIVLASLATVVVGAISADPSTGNIGSLTDGGLHGILQSAGLLFFAFAGYATHRDVGRGGDRSRSNDPARDSDRARHHARRLRDRGDNGTARRRSGSTRGEHGRPS